MLAVDRPAALLLIDLQRGITARPLTAPVEPLLERAARLADAFRERGDLVVRVSVGFSADGADALPTRVDRPPPAGAHPADFSEPDPRVPSAPTDLPVRKRGWDAFHGTELDLQLRRRGIKAVVLAGIATSIGVEGTARTGHALAYDQIVATDAVGDTVAGAHANSLEVILPRLARLATTDEIVAAIAG